MNELESLNVELSDDMRRKAMIELRALRLLEFQKQVCVCVCVCVCVRACVRACVRVCVCVVIL